MQAFELDQLLIEHGQRGKLYHDFFWVPSMSMGLYILPAGGTDPQSPHDEDEVYYVLSGRATIRVGDEDRPVQPGSLIFVAAREEHRFHSIIEELRLLVFFAPAHGDPPSS